MLLLLPPLAHCLDFAGWFSEDPRFLVSGLAVAPPTRAGLLAGYPGWVDGNAGVTTQALGALSARDWLRGQVPWWNPYSGVGMPLGGEVQASTFFLPFVLLLRLPHGVTLLKVAVQVLTGLGTLALLREMGLGRLAALTGGLLAEFNGCLAWYADGPIMPVPFLPWLLFGLERSARGGKGGVAVIAISLAYSIVAGFPETAYLDGLLALVWAGVLLSQARAARVFAGRVLLGGTIGLLLAAPVALAFLQSLPISFIGGHATSMATRHMVAGDAPMLLFPYVDGPLLAHLTKRVDEDPWFQIGGYFGTVTLFLSILSLMRGGSRLRWALAGWIALASARALGVPAAIWLVNLVPALSWTLFDVYMAPSCAIAAIVLAASALDDRALGLRSVLAAGVVTALVAGASVVAGWDTIRTVAQTDDRPLVLASLAWGVVALAAIALARATGMRRGAAWIAVIDAVVLFSVPLLSGVRTPRLDPAPIELLRRTIGLGRFASVGGIVPNYGALYGLPGINDNALPQPAAWVDYVKAALMPGSDGLSFFPQVSDGLDFVAHQAGYEAAGVTAVVTAVVTPAGSVPFERASGTADEGAREPRALQPGASLDVDVPAALTHAGSIDAIGIVIGTYVGVSDGTVAARLCTPGACADGGTSLAGAIDNARLVIRLDRALPAAAGARLSLRLSHPAGTRGVAIWQWHKPDGASVPGLTLFYVAAAEHPVFLARAGQMDLYRLPGAASYFSSRGGPCRLAARSRTAVVADCGAAATLTRLELAYPGWRAAINGHAVTLGTTGRIFQSLPLPPGRSVVRFTYAPPSIEAGYACGLAGIMALLLVLLRLALGPGVGLGPRSSWFTRRQ